MQQKGLMQKILMAYTFQALLKNTDHVRMRSMDIIKAWKLVVSMGTMWLYPLCSHLHRNLSEERPMTRFAPIHIVLYRHFFCFYLVVPLNRAKVWIVNAGFDLAVNVNVCNK